MPSKASGRLTATINASGKLHPGLDAHHILTSITNAAGVAVMTIGYEADGRVSQIQDASGNSAGLSYSIDGASKGLVAGSTIEATTDALGNPTEVVRDGHGNIIRNMQRINDNSTPDDASDDPWLVTVYTFNSFDDQTSQSWPFTAIGDARYTTNPDPNDPSKCVNRSAYDANGNLLTSTDSAGNTVTYGNYDKFGNPGTVTDALGNTTRDAYDSDTGALLSTTDAAGTISNYSYIDGNLQSIVQVMPDGTTVTFSSNTYENGHLTSTIDQTGITHNYVYDANGNQTLSWYLWIDPVDSSKVQTIVTRLEGVMNSRPQV